MSAQTFYIAAVALLAASFVANGGRDGDRFDASETTTRRTSCCF